MNILIIKLSAIGDVIHTLPALNALRKHYPHARITWAVEEAAYPLIEGHTALNRVLLSQRKRWLRRLRKPGSRADCLGEAYLFIKKLRDTRYDLIIDFHQLLKSGVLAAMANGKRKAGYNKGMEHMEHSYLFLNERIPCVSMEHHALSRNMMLLGALGIHSEEIVFNVPIREQDRRDVDELLSKHGLQASDRLVAINPMAQWDTKLWSERKFSELADRLIEDYDVCPVFTGGPEDRHMVENIRAGMKREAPGLAGETNLKMLAAFYERIKFLISTDTGPMHLAAALGKPVVAIFGPTAPWRTGPFGAGHQIIRACLKCSPCFRRKCSSTDCMAQISTEDVLNGVRKLNLL